MMALFTTTGVGTIAARSELLWSDLSLSLACLDFFLSLLGKNIYECVLVLIRTIQISNNEQVTLKVVGQANGIIKGKKWEIAGFSIIANDQRWDWLSE